MANGTHKGSEFKNVTETWDENERKRAAAPGGEEINSNDAAPGNDLEQVIRQEAAEYDNENKESQLLSGDRATLNDDVDADDSGE